MDNLDIFAERIRKLRERYGLGYSDLTRISKINGVTRINSLSVRNWEKGKYYLSAEGIITLTEIFGISGNWLLGLSDDMYSEDVLLRLESRNGQVFPSVNILGREIAVPLEYSESYSSIFLRGDMYSLEERGDIIYYIFAICFEWRQFLYERVYEFQDGFDNGRVSKLWDWFIHNNDFVSGIVDEYNKLMFSKPGR